MKHLARTLNILIFGACLVQLGYYHRQAKAVEAQGIVLASSFKAIEAMHQSIPWEDRIKRKNELLQAVCKRQKTKLCTTILDDFVKDQRLAGR